MLTLWGMFGGTVKQIIGAFHVPRPYTKFKDAQRSVESHSQFRRPSENGRQSELVRGHLLSTLNFTIVS